jgi:hypothetical protein
MFDCGWLKLGDLCRHRPVGDLEAQPPAAVPTTAAAVGGLEINAAPKSSTEWQPPSQAGTAVGFVKRHSAAMAIKTLWATIVAHPTPTGLTLT